MTVRIVTCIDIDTDDPVDAYKTLYETMSFLLRIQSKIEGWESSDEWFGEDGEPIPENRVVDHRMTYFKANEPYDDRSHLSKHLQGDDL